MPTSIYYVYAYLREDGSPYYIGKGKGNRYKNRHTISIPPKDRIQFIQQNLSESDAFTLETELIAFYGRKDMNTGILRNLTDGGEGSSNPSIETRDKIRESLISYHENNPEARIKAAEYAKMAGLSEEGRTAKSEAMQGNQHAKGMTYKHTEEAKANIAAAVRIRQLGTTASPETKLKMSESKKGSRNPMASEENRKKVGLSKIGRKKMYRDDGSGYYGYPEKEPLNAD